MKKLTAIIAFLLMLTACGNKQNNTMSTTITPNPQNALRAQQFLKDAQTYFLATVDGDQPHVRPFGTAEIFEGRLYIQTGKSKNVYKQLKANPRPKSAPTRTASGFASSANSSPMSVYRPRRICSTRTSRFVQCTTRTMTTPSSFTCRTPPPPFRRSHRTPRHSRSDAHV